MWTVVWTEDGEDRYDRLNRAELGEFLRDLLENEAVSVEDILVFEPETERNIDELLAELEGSNRDGR